MEKLSVILDESQRSLVSHNSCLKRLQTLLYEESTTAKRNGANGKNKDLIDNLLNYCMDSVLLVSKKEPSVERLLKFLTTFIASSAINEEHFNKSIKHLLLRSKAVDKNVRIRSCQIFAEVMMNLNEDCEISASLWTEILQSLLPRLKDKNATVRIWTIKALTNFQNDEDAEDLVVNGILKLLMYDTASTVRAAAIEAICLTPKTLPAVIERVKDVSADVRLQVLKKCMDCIQFRQLPVTSRINIVKYTLDDREEDVRDAAIALVIKWISQLDNKTSKFLQLMNLQVHESEAERLGWTVMEAVYNRKITDPNMLQAIQEDQPNWSGSFESLNPSDILWVRIRYDYAKSKPDSPISSDILESIMPDTVIICDLLNDIPVTLLHNNIPRHLTLKYLLQLAAYVEGSDVSGREKLSAYCRSSVITLSFPEHLIDYLLETWIQALDNSNFDQILEVADILSKNFANEDITADKETRLLSSLRYLQLYSWVMTKVISIAAGAEIDTTKFESCIPIVLSCLQQPFIELRNQSVTCMGLLGMMSERLCLEHKNILSEVISTDLEDASIRCYALKSLTDYAMVYPNIFSNDISLINILIRIQENAHPNDSLEHIELASLATESSAKLFFSGIVSDSRLFAILLRSFFLSSTTFVGDVTSTNNNEITAKLLQTLSIFFHTVFAVDSSLLSLALTAIPEFINDVVCVLRGSFDHDANTIGLEKIIHKILALCDGIQGPNTKLSNDQLVTQRKFRMTFASCLCREIMKLGKIKSDKAIMKDLMKCLAAIAPTTWLSASMKQDVLRTLKVIGLCISSLDKTTQNALEKYIKACETIDAPQSTDSSTENLDFYSLAPGLQDFITTFNDATSDTEDDYSVSIPKKTSSRTKDSTSKTKSRAAGIDKENDYVEASLNTMQSSRPSRASKMVAASKISSSVVDINDDDD